MPTKFLLKALFASLLIAFSAAPASAQAPEIRTDLSGRWVINDELSDNTDDQVEEAIEAGGGKGSRGSLTVRKIFTVAVRRSMSFMTVSLMMMS